MIRRCLAFLIGVFLLAPDLPAQVPQVNPGGVVNTANYASGPVAPGSIVSIFGVSLAVRQGSAASVPLPTDINGTRVFFNGFAAPLFFVSPNQINAQVPWELVGQTEASLTVMVAGQATGAQTIRLAPFGPGAFSLNSQGTGQGAILDESSRAVDAANPATAGITTIQIYCTGLGPVTNQPATGSSPTATALSLTVATPRVFIGGAQATVLFSGLAPGLVGLYQVNVRVPAAVTAGNAVPVVMSIGDVVLKTVTMAVHSSAGLGNLRIQATGLPVGVAATVSVTSENGIRATVIGGQTIQLPSGTYTILPNPVPVGDASYHALRAQQVTHVPADVLTSVDVLFTAVIPQTTRLLDQQTLQNLTVSPDGSRLFLPATSQAAQALFPGQILIVETAPAAPSGLLRKIVSVSQEGSQIVVTTTQATFSEAFRELSFSFTGTLSGQNLQVPSGIPPGIEIRTAVRPNADLAAASRPAQAATGSASTESGCEVGTNVKIPDTRIIVGGQPLSLFVSGEIEICGTFQLDVDMGILGLRSLTAVAALSERTHLTITGDYHGTRDWKVNLLPKPLIFPIPSTPFAATVMPFVGAGFELNGGLSFGATQTASIVGGISYSNGRASPVFRSSHDFQPDPVTLEGNASVEVFAGVSIGIELYRVATAELSPQMFLGLDADLVGNPWWKLSAGLEGSAGVKFSAFGFKDLAEVEFPNLFQFSKVIAQAPGPFLPADATPALSSVRPSTAPLGSPALQLVVTGSNFVPSSTVAFKGVVLSTRFISSGELTATLPSTALITTGPFEVTVVNPGPPQRISQALTFTVANPSTQQSPTVCDLTFSPNPVIGGNVSTGTITLCQAAPSGGAAAELTSYDTHAVLQQSSVTVASGFRTANFTVRTQIPSLAVGVRIRASTSTGSYDGQLSVQPALTLLSATLNASSVAGGGTATLTLTLSGPAPAPGGIAVSLLSSSTALPLPTTLVVQAGQSVASTTVQVGTVITSTTVTVTATFGASSRTAEVTVTAPLGSGTVLSSVMIGPGTVASGASATIAVTLSGPAPAPGGAAVTLSSSNPSAFPPPSTLVVQAGQNSASTTIQAGTVTASTTVTLTATYGGSSRIANATVTPTSGAATIPGAPQNLGASAGNGQVGLSWGAPSSNGGATITSYRVFRGTTNSNRLIVTSGGCANLGAVLSCTDTGLTNGQSYNYIVSAVNSIGQGPPSNSATATVVAANLQPSISSISPSQVTVNQATTLTVNGSNFHSGFSARVSASGVNVGVAVRAVTFVSSTQVQVQVTMSGSAPYTATLRITNPGGLSATGSFQVAAANLQPSINSISPTSVPVNQQTTFTVNKGNF